MFIVFVEMRANQAKAEVYHIHSGALERPIRNLGEVHRVLKESVKEINRSISDRVFTEAERYREISLKRRGGINPLEKSFAITIICQYQDAMPALMSDMASCTYSDQRKPSSRFSSLVLAATSALLAAHSKVSR